MNDYKELIAKFRAKKNDGWQKDGSYQEQIITVQDILDAADAIEQLVKERDAAVEDIACLANDPNVPAESLCKKFTNHGCCCYNYFTGEQVRDCTGFEWRGVREVEHE